MWIRSQSKVIILDCKSVAISNEIQYNPKEYIGKFSVFCENVILGFYSTKEKALKVLDMIEEHIEYNSNFGVFQMPQDEEVVG